MKKILRKLTNILGYDIVKTKAGRHGDPSKTFQVKVGNYLISMPGNNPLVKHYELFPNYNIELGKLAEIINKKYPGCSIIDIGANVGDTIAVVKSVIDIPIIGIEGDEFSYKFLNQNASLFNNLYIINQFLGDNNEQKLVNTEKEGWNTTLIPDATGKKSITLKTLDEILNDTKLNGRDIKLIKIDAEGFDTIILRGSFNTLAKHNPVLYFEYNRENMDIIGEDGLSTLYALIELGYNNIAFLDNHNRCLMYTSLTQTDIIKQLHDYADGINGLIPHYDLCIFHKNDNDIAQDFLKSNNSNTVSKI